MKFMYLHFNAFLINSYSEFCANEFSTIEDHRPITVKHSELYALLPFIITINSLRALIRMRGIDTKKHIIYLHTLTALTPHQQAMEIVVGTIRNLNVLFCKDKKVSITLVNYCTQLTLCCLLFCSLPFRK